MADDLLAELFSSKVRAAVLGYLLPRPHLGFSLTDLSRQMDLPVSSLQHECYKLHRLGILTVSRAGAARRYQPDPAFPLLAPLTTLVARAIGAETALKAALEGVAAIELAFFAGPLSAPLTGTGAGCLVLVGELTLEEVDGALARVTAMTPASPHPGQVELAYFRPGDWASRRANRNPLVTDLLAAPALPLVGPTVHAGTSRAS